ncbi:hypothetical protein GBA52_007522 [Prunus armeniaca]|nr:hypothetical protein GBA52_007522 [Prunus armeniaca]
MGHLNLPASKRSPRHWRLLDLVSAAFFGIVIVFFLLVFTRLGDSLAASGRQALLLSTNADPKQRHRLVALVELGQHQQPIEACPVDAVDHMPCEDPRRNSQLSREMNFYRERHCPLPEETPLCLIPPPNGYKIPVQWPDSLHKIWHSNMPHNKIADRKGHQGWMKLEGPHFIFPGGGTMFPDGAIQYIEKLGQYIPISDGVLRTALDMGCGVRAIFSAPATFSYHKGIWNFADATYFLEVDRLLRPGGYLVISGPPVQWTNQDKEWADLQGVARALCYELIAVDGNTAVWKKPAGDSCLPNQNEFGLELCGESDDPSDAWYYNLKKCMSRTSSVKGEYAVGMIPKWPERLTKAPARATLMRNGIDVFEADTRRWARRFYGTSTDELIFLLDGLRCEPFSTYPRSYDFIHVTGIESLIKHPGSTKNSCNLVDLMVEMDRMLRPEGTVLVRDSPEVIEKVARIAHAVRWTASIHEKEPESHGREKILVATKTFWTLPSASN